MKKDEFLIHKAGLAKP
nr:hypothetical protein [Tanacetum cinerariifolium]